jgi:hypothetical protein
MRAALVVLLCLTGVASAKKSKKPKPETEQQLLSKTLDARSEAVAACAMKALEGAQNLLLVVSAQLLVNNSGQVMSVDVKANGPRPDETRVCVEQAMRDTPWPKIRSPLAQVQRTWKFSTK